MPGSKAKKVVVKQPKAAAQLESVVPVGVSMSEDSCSENS